MKVRQTNKELSKEVRKVKVYLITSTDFQSNIRSTYKSKVRGRKDIKICLIRIYSFTQIITPIISF